jgi:hypothetical protein
MGKELTRKQLQEQLDAERARNDAMVKRLAAIESVTVISRSGTVTEAVDGDFKDFESWKNAGLALGYSHPVRMGGPSSWAFKAGGVMGGVLGAWDGSQGKGYFIQRRAL